MTDRLHDCHDCGAKPGQVHIAGCDVERCSTCGRQRISCGCDEGQDQAFARWTGLCPGSAEAAALGIDLNEFTRRGLPKIMLAKPGEAG